MVPPIFVNLLVLFIPLCYGLSAKYAHPEEYVPEQQGCWGIGGSRNDFFSNPVSSFEGQCHEILPSIFR